MIVWSGMEPVEYPGFRIPGHPSEDYNSWRLMAAFSQSNHGNNGGRKTVLTKR